MLEEKEFDTWNELKKKTHSYNILSTGFPNEQEVWICVLGKNIGREQNGGEIDFSRPVLVIKKFNNQIFWVVPLSSRQKKLDFYYNFTDPLFNNVSAIPAQLRLISIRRFSRKLYELPSDDYYKICFITRSLIPSPILKIETPPFERGISEPEGTVDT